MNKILLQKVKICQKGHPAFGQTKDILIEDGFIKEIAETIKTEDATVYHWENASVSPGWIDMATFVGDPGLEHKEDVHSLANAAAKGGFTSVACLPNTHPTIQSKADILYLKNQLAKSTTTLFPIGALSRNAEGKEMTEMMDMNAAGAIAFSDGIHPVQNSGLLLRALQYVKAFDGKIITLPHDYTLAPNGQINEGKTSTILGMPGIPHIAEELKIKRIIDLVAYADSAIHLSNVSSGKSVQLIREAKKNKLKITASVNPLNLIYTDEALEDYNVNLKVLPPIRTETDRLALLDGLKDGTIDFIVSNHVPQDEESKNLEFPYADFGAIGLETCFRSLLSYTDLDPMLIVEALYKNQSNIFGIKTPAIEVGTMANLTVFSTEGKSIFSKENIGSKSNNSPFLDKELKGKIFAVFNNQTATIH